MQQAIYADKIVLLWTPSIFNIGSLIPARGPTVGRSGTLRLASSSVLTEVLEDSFKPCRVEINTIQTLFNRDIPTHFKNTKLKGEHFGVARVHECLGLKTVNLRLRRGTRQHALVATGKPRYALYPCEYTDLLVLLRR